jgi:hypothetical protein
MTSVARELADRMVPPAAVTAAVVQAFGLIFALEPTPVTRAALEETAGPAPP